MNAFLGLGHEVPNNGSGTPRHFGGAARWVRFLAHVWESWRAPRRRLSAALIIAWDVTEEVSIVPAKWRPGIPCNRTENPVLACQRIIGIDLGVSTSHNACVIDIATSTVIARRKFVSKPSDLDDLVAVARRGLDPDATIGVVMEATAGAWYAPAAWFSRHDMGVYRVSTSKAADLRKFFSRHVKTNTIDAETLARLGLLAPDSLEPLEFGDSHRAGLDRRCRAAHRYTVQSTNHLIRIRQLLYHLIPRFNLAVTGAFAMSDLALLEKYANPHLLAAVPRARLVALIRKASTGHVPDSRADLWLQAAREAVELFGDETGIAFDDVAAEIASEVHMWRACQTELAAHETAREAHYRIVDPDGLARSLPGIKDAGGPVIVVALGRAQRFPDRCTVQELHRPRTQSIRDR